MNATGPPARPGRRRERVLVVDLGTTTSSAILLAGGRSRLLKEPATGRDWRPTAVFRDGDRWLVGSAAEDSRDKNPLAYRTEFKPEIGSPHLLVLDGRPYGAEDLTVAVLATLRAEAATFGPPPGRLLVTMPAQTPPDPRRRDAMLSAGRRAGFTDVELLLEPVAAAFATTLGGGWTCGQTVLVYDFGGGTFDAAVVRMDATGAPRLLAAGGLSERCAGRDVDAAVVEVIRGPADAWFASRCAGLAEAQLAEAVEQAVHGTAIRLKESLTGRQEAIRLISVEIPLVSLDRPTLERLAEPILARTVDCCTALLEQAGFTRADLDAVLLVGGSSKMPVVADYLARHLSPRVVPAADPVLAVVEGAARWAEGIPDRWAAVAPPSPWERPLRAILPDSRPATLTRWFVEPGDSFRAGADLARVRLADNTLLDLRADSCGRAQQLHLPPDSQITTGDWLITVGRPPGPEELRHPPEPLAAWPEPVRACRFSPNGRWLALAFRRAPDDALLRVTAPDPGPGPGPGHGHDLASVPVRGRIHTLAWSPDARRLAFGWSGDTDADQTISLLTLVEGAGGALQTQVTHRPHQPGAVARLAFLPDGEQLVVSFGTGHLQVLDLAGERRRTLRLGPPYATPLAVHPDGRLVAVITHADHHTLVQLIELGRPGEPGELGELGEPPTAATRPPGLVSRSWQAPAQVRDLAFTPDGRLLLAVGGGPRRRPAGFICALTPDGADDAPAWQVDFDGEDPTPEDGGHRYGGYPLAVDVSPDGTLASVASRDGLISIYHLGEPAVRRLRWTAAAVGAPEETRLDSLCFSPDGHRLAIAGSFGAQQWALTDRYGPTSPVPPPTSHVPRPTTRQP